MKIKMNVKLPETMTWEGLVAGVLIGLVFGSIIASIFAGIFSSRPDNKILPIIIKGDLRDIESLDSACDRCMNGEWGGFCNEIYGWREEMCVCDRYSAWEESDNGRKRHCISGRMNPKYLNSWEREDLDQPIIEKESPALWGLFNITKYCDDTNGDGEIGAFECWGFDEEEYYKNIGRLECSLEYKQNNPQLINVTIDPEDIRRALDLFAGRQE